jgi:hypothetical protein
MAVHKKQKSFHIWLTIIAFSITITAPIPISHAQGEVQARVIPDTLNVRERPSATAPVIGQFTRGTLLRVTGWDGTVWVYVTPVDGGIVGWAHREYLDFPDGFDPASLPIINATGTGGDSAEPPPAPVIAAGIPAGVVPTVGSAARAIFLNGQALGNRADVFAKVGDSITDMPMFLFAIGAGQQQLGDYAYLQAVINYFSGSFNSFANVSAAAHGGWTSFDLLNPAQNYLPGVCGADETPLACEYRVSRPSVALIMIGTNDIYYGVDSAAYRANLETIVQISLDRGVIPVLSTIPDNLIDPAMGARVPEFNDIIRSVAGAYGVPLWDYWLALQALPNKGLAGDGLHPSFDPAPGTSAIFTAEHLQYGFNVRNLTALLVLNAVWQGAMY